MRIIRDPQLYASPLKVFHKIIKRFWPTPGAGSGVVCLFPTQPLLEFWEEKLLQESGSYGGARFLLFAGLIREIWEEQRTDWTSLSTEEVSFVLRKVFTQLRTEGKIPYYGQALTSAGFFSALREEITTLKRSGVSARALREWVTRDLTYERPALQDFSLIYYEYQRLLSVHKWADQEEKLAHATVDLPQSAWAKSLSHLFVIGFSDFTVEQERFLRALARVTEVTILLDVSAEGRPGVYSPRLRLEKSPGAKEGSGNDLAPFVTGEVQDSAAELLSNRLPQPAEEPGNARDGQGGKSGPSGRTAQVQHGAALKTTNLSYLQSALWQPETVPVQPGVREGDETLHFLQIDGGWRREMKVIALEVKKALHKDPTLDPGEIGVITPYTGNLKEIYEIFTATGLPVTGQIKKTLRFQPVARALLQPFVVVNQGFSWAGMVKLLRWAGVIPTRQLYSVLPEGLEDWNGVIRDIYPEAETEFVFSFLSKIPQEAWIGEYLNLCRQWLASPQLLKALLFTENRCEVSPEVGGEERPQQLVKAGFIQTSLLCTVQEILANLIFLTGLLGDWQISLADFILILEDILSTGAKSIPYGWGSGIRILSPQEARGLRFKVTFLTGLNEGFWPTRASTGWALEEGDLSFWRQRGFSLRTAAEDLSLQRLAFYNALSSATGTLVVSCCRSDEDGHPVNPSTFWEDLRGLFPALPLQVPVKGFSLLYSTLPVADKPAHEPLFTPMRKQAAGKTAAGRRRPVFTGILGDRAADEVRRALTKEPLSLTALEDYAACPFAFFCSRLLKLDQLTEPTYLPDRLTEGSILHAVLRDFFREHRGEALNEREYQVYLKEIRSLVNLYYPEVSPHRPAIYQNLSALQRESLLVKLCRLLQEEITWQKKTGQTYRPRYIELGFGGPVSDGDPDSTGRPFQIVGEWVASERVHAGSRATSDKRPATSYEITDRTHVGPHAAKEVVLRVRGKIDRVDLAEDGGFIVYDYKSGGSDRVKGIKEGKLLQLPLYLQALQELYPEARKAVGMSYYNLARSERKDGFWWEGFSDRFQIKLRELKEAEWQELLADSRRRALQYYIGMISGEFPLLPPEEKCPTYCLFSRVCRGGSLGGESA
ncbi:MAG TPA: hypothetical protein GXZ36_03420 [Firmicutes bacterium]|nr:hypothetical protein [Bacillota bacterium]